MKPDPTDALTVELLAAMARLQGVMEGGGSALPVMVVVLRNVSATATKLADALALDHEPPPAANGK